MEMPTRVQQTMDAYGRMASAERAPEGGGKSSFTIPIRKESRRLLFVVHAEFGDDGRGFGLRKKVDWKGDHFAKEKRYPGMLLIIAILLLLFWGGGFAFHVAGGLIHLLLVVALIVFILHFVRGGRGAK